MRIGLVSFHAFLKPGGVKTHILGLHKELKKRKVYSKIIAPRRSWEENYGRDVILLGTSFPVTFGGSVSDFGIHFNPLAIESTLRREKFNVLHFHNFGFPSSFQILERSRSLNILTFHSNIKGSQLLKTFPVLFDILKKIIDWKIDGIIGVAPLSIKFFEDYKGPKIVIPNGIDLEIFNPNAPKVKKFLDSKINIIFVGRIDERKGLIYLLQAYRILEKKHKNLRLIIIGDGELRKECENFVKKNNLKEVHFEGMKSSKEVASYCTASDIFCAPSIYGESFGIVILEGMAVGLPVVGFANQGYKELLRGTKGEKFLAKSRDYKGLAQKLEILIRDRNLREEMRDWGLKAVQKYSWSNLTDQVLDFYKLCQKEKQKRPKQPFSFNKSFNKALDKVDEILQKDILDWLE